jgi:hypothetical protein
MTSEKSKASTVISITKLQNDTVQSGSMNKENEDANICDDNKEKQNDNKSDQYVSSSTPSTTPNRSKISPQQRVNELRREVQYWKQKLRETEDMVRSNPSKYFIHFEIHSFVHLL